MTLYSLALYVIPAVLAVISLAIGYRGLAFYWAEVIQAPRGHVDDDA